jgi:hypothetical protein
MNAHSIIFIIMPTLLFFILFSLCPLYYFCPGLQFIPFRVNTFRLVINPVWYEHVETDEFEYGSEFILPCVNVE